MATDTDERTTLERLASELSQAFVGDTRQDGTTFRKLRDGSPEWMTTVIHEAHGDMMPDDWRYAFCERAADALAEGDEDGDDLEPDVYTHDLTSWLASRNDRYGYVDDCIAEMGSDLSEGILPLIARGQWYEMRETFDLLKSALETIADEQEEDDDDE